MNSGVDSMFIFTAPFAPEFIESNTDHYHHGYEKRYDYNAIQTKFTSAKELCLEDLLFINGSMRIPIYSVIFGINTSYSTPSEKSLRSFQCCCSKYRLNQPKDPEVSLQDSEKNNQSKKKPAS